MFDTEKDPLVKRNQTKSDSNGYIDYSPNTTRGSTSSQATLEPAHSTPLLPQPPTDKPKKERSLAYPILFCMSAWFVLNTNYALFSPYFPSEAISKGASNTDVGIIFAAFEITEFLATPIASYLVQRFGPKYVFLLGLAVETGACFGFGFVRLIHPRVGFIGISILVRLIQGTGAVLTQTAAFVIILHILPPEQEEKRGLALGAMETAGGLGLMLGPTLGGVLYGIGGFQLPFSVVGGILLVMGLVASCIFPHNTKGDVDVSEKPGFMVLLRSKIIWFAILCIFVNMAAWAFMEPTLEIFLKEKYHVSSVVVGAAFSVCVALYAVFAPIAGFVGGKSFGYFPVMVVGVFLEAVGFLIMGPTPLPNQFLGFALPEAIWFQFVGLGVIGLGAALAMVPIMPWISQHAAYIAHDTDELVAGITAGAFSLGGIVGPIASSLLVDHFRYEWASTIFAGLLWFLFVLMCIAWACKLVELPAHKKSESANGEGGDGGDGGDGEGEGRYAELRDSRSGSARWSSAPGRVRRMRSVSFSAPSISRKNSRGGVVGGAGGGAVTIHYRHPDISGVHVDVVGGGQLPRELISPTQEEGEGEEE